MTSPTRGSAPTVVDAAGAAMGGAATLLGELTLYLDQARDDSVHVIGRETSLGPQWLLRRELLARGAGVRIALNNVGFAGGAGTVTLLRNALHFASAAELTSLGYRPSRTLRLQTRVVRAAARRSGLLIVPCDAMAERVSRHAPYLADRIEVRMEPASRAPWAADAGRRAEGPPSILVPVLNAPYKRLQMHLRRLLDALDRLSVSATVVMTAHAHEFRSLGDDARLEFTGPLARHDLDSRWRQATAIYFPTQLESFGYPLAEARVNGLPVIALDTSQNRQIAGPALRPFDLERPSTLAEALEAALNVPVAPDPGPFDPRSYFDRLLRS